MKWNCITILDLKYIGTLLAISIQLFIHLLENNFACHVNKNIMNYEYTVGMHWFYECCKFHVKLSFPFDKCFFELPFAWFLVHCHEQGQTSFVQKSKSHSLTNIEFKQQHVSKVSYKNFPLALFLIFSLRDSARLFESIIFGLRYRKIFV